MGWLWASEAPAKPSSQAPAQSPPAQPTRSTPQADPDADPEITKFLALIQAEMGGSGSSKPAEQVPSRPTPASTQQPAAPPAEPTTKASSWSSWFSRPSSTTTPPADNVSSRTAYTEPIPPISTSAPMAAVNNTSTESIAEATLPTSMDCRQAFDLAFHCQSPGGQWNAIYRYGSVRTCSDFWDDFWFCMRSKGYQGQMKEDMIRAHYRKKEQAKYGPGKPSSEDIWEPRERKVEPGTVFSDTYEQPDVSDAEWQRAEMERLRRIRQGL